MPHTTKARIAPFLTVFSTILLALGVGGAALAAPPAQPASHIDPLFDAASYSLYVRPEGRDPSRYFPLGVLFPRDNDELVSYGFDFTEEAVGPLLDPKGSTFLMDWFVARDRPLPPPPPDDHLGLFVASWAWHLMPHEGKIGEYGPFGKEPSYFDPAVHDYLLAADTALAKRFGSTTQPALMWSLDNEWEGQLDDSPVAVAGFAAYLKATYGTLAKLNAAWTTGYADWNDIVPPQSEPHITNAAAWLDWHAYQDGYFTRMTADRYHALFANDPRHRPVAYKSTQQSFDLQTVGKKRVLDPALLCDETRPFGGWYGADIYGADDALNYDVNFAAQCIRPLAVDEFGKLFLTEVNNHGGPGWQWANSLWRTLGNGAKAYDLFCFGMPAATSDSDTYGMTAPDATLRGKAPYAARFAYAIRRNEAFWERSQPAKGVPRIALLLNRPDVLLADDIPGQMWAGPANSRTAIYAALRASGFWVDVIPYTKLNATFLAPYDALIIVGGDHLSPDACTQIDRYVRAGGKLIADRLAGFYDLHHQAQHGLEPILGVHVSEPKPTGTDNGISLSTPKGDLHGTGQIPATATSAQIAVLDATDKPLVFHNAVGKGTTLFVDAELGTFRGNAPDLLGVWLTKLLQSVSLAPAYAATDGPANTATLRVEQPWTADGNLALVVANVGEKEHSPVSLDIKLPAGNGTNALWSPAESAALTPITVRPLSGSAYRIRLPAFATAGTLLFLPNHPPLIALDAIITAKHGIDGHLPVLTPGVPTTVSATLLNPALVPAAPGHLRVRALAGWKVAPAEFTIPALAAHGVYHVTFTITPPTKDVLPYAERMYPINLHWSDGKTDRAVTSTPVGVDIDPAVCPCLLTENATYPADFARRLKTGATYRYPDAGPAQIVADPGDGNGKSNAAPKALQDGSSRWLMASESAHFHLATAQNTATIEYDLKAEYPLHNIRLLSSGFPGYPTHMDISISNDAVHYTLVGSTTPVGGPGSGKWLESDRLDGKTARYIRLNVNIQGGNGYVNEVEVWGYRK